jgi:putative CocE/NonD family hydrolase
MINAYRPDGIEIKIDVKTPMRDDVRLSVDLYKPLGKGPFPVILDRTPYGKQGSIEIAIFFAQNGYVFAAQDVRGRFDSEGHFTPLRNEARDGYDTLEWIGAQPWCDGNVGMWGGSYEGMVQWAAATQGSTYLKTIVPYVSAPNIYKDGMFIGGAYSLSLALMWRCFTTGRTNQSHATIRWSELFRKLPLKDVDRYIGRAATFFKDWVSHPSYDQYWKDIAFDEMFSKITIPVFQFSGWYDVFATGIMPTFRGLKEKGGSENARQHQKVIMGPWIHHTIKYTHAGDVDFGSKSILDLRLIQLQWYDYWLKDKDNGIADDAPIKLFVMGINKWRDEYEWPLARTEFKPYYLHSGGSANSLHGDGMLSTDLPEEDVTDHFDYDPEFSVPTAGGGNCCWPEIVAWGAYDQREVEQRKDVLCYTTEPLAGDLDVTGPIKLKLYAASDAPDTDFTTKLVDVAPSGYAMNVADGIIRARYRDSLETPTLLEPGKVYEYEISLSDTSNVFLKGHRIRLEISSSNFPRFDRNPNTGHEFGADDEIRSANQQVYHGKTYPSQIILPVIPGS